MTTTLDFNPAFQKAFDLIENTGKHLFITGKAGVGKSTLLNYCREHSKKNIVVLAPTGVAALNVHGQTIHRFFNFPINVSVEKISSGLVLPRVKRIYKNLETLIIDEISMLRADILDCIDAFLKIYGPQTDVPFGGVQIVLVGDLYQLPPVVSKQEQDVFFSKYDSPYFFSADIFKSMPLEVIELTKIYRQQDEHFIHLLNHIRNNNVNDEELQELNCSATRSFSSDDFNIHLTTTNTLSDQINQQELNKLEGSLYQSHAIIDGQFSPDFYPTAETLEFKLGSQIMFLNNDSKNRWVNGSVGYIEDIKFRNDKILYLKIRLQKEYKLVDVFPYTWEIYKYTLEGREIVSEIIGSFTQYPFRLAWAVTIHKSQGKTFDNVTIDIGNGTFATGQLYVALSRCTSLSGIKITKPLQKHHILTDDRICRFMLSYGPLQELSATDKCHIIQQAILKKQKLEITYQKINHEISHRIIVPLRIKEDNLLAYCTQRNQQRSFCLSRILSLKYTQ